MNVTDIFKNSFNYSFNNLNNYLILGIIFLICTIVCGFLLGISAITGIPAVVILVGLLVALVAIVVDILFLGYGFGILSSTIAGEDTVPEFNFLTNLFDGLKVLVSFIIYALIPAILIGIGTAILVGIAAAGPDASIIVTLFAILGGLVIFLVTTVLAAIFFFAIAKFAETGNFGAIFEFSEIIEKIRNIGILKYVLLIQLLIIVSSLLCSLSLLMHVIPPVIGTIIWLLVVPAFLLVFFNRALGLIYKQG